MPERAPIFELDNNRLRSAPSVHCPVGRSLFAGCLTLALWSGGALLALHSAAAAAAFGWRQALLAVVALASGAAAARGWWRTPQGRLRWDGQGWFWDEQGRGERPGTVSVALDLQRRMLLRFRANEGKVHWLWLDSARAAGRWHELRCAAHARGSAKRRRARTSLAHDEP